MAKWTEESAAERAQGEAEEAQLSLDRSKREMDAAHRDPSVSRDVYDGMVRTHLALEDKLERALKSLQTGAKGGTYYVGPSGMKVYVKK
jgi:hypothetical protein